MSLTFELPQLLDNLTSWGPPPVTTTIFEIPIVPITKVDKAHKAIDWLGVTHAGAIATKDAEKDDFEVVNTKKQKKQPGQGVRNNAAPWSQPRGRGAARGRGGGRGRGRAVARPRIVQTTAGHNSSLIIRDRWQVMEHIVLSALGKINDVTIPRDEDITFTGHTFYYDQTFDHMEAHKPIALKCPPKTFYKVTPMDDDILRGIAIDFANKGKRVIITNDNILSTLMTSPRSIYQWEIKATKNGNIVFLDWREDDELCNCYSVSETAIAGNVPYDGEDAKENINSATNLSIESTMLCKNVAQVVLTKSRSKIDLGEGVQRQDCPFVEEGDEPSATVYRYRQWTLNPGASDELVVVARCDIDGAFKPKGSTDVQLLRTFAVNEYEDKPLDQTWRQKLATNRGAVLANFFKINACKVSRWACMSVLSGADKVKLAFVSRSFHANNQSHIVYGCDTKDPIEMANQVGLNVKAMWGVFNNLVQGIMKRENGQYMLVKDQGKPTLSLFAMGESDDEDDEEEEEDEEDA